MTKDTYFFVEGESDEKFLTAILLKHFIDGERAQFVLLGGDYKRLSEQIRIDQMREGRRNLVIVDADVPDFAGVSAGVSEILRNLATGEAAAGRPFSLDFFLFPNNEVDGNLEALVRGLTPDAKTGFWNCIDSYAACINAIQVEGFRSITAKTKIYIYVNAHEHIKWNSQGWLLDSGIWNLESPQLDSLLTFLDKYFERKR